MRVLGFSVDVDEDVGDYNAIVRRLPGRHERVSVLDPLPIACPDGQCRALDGDIVVHRDSNHLSARFVRTRPEALERALRRAGIDLG